MVGLLNTVDRQASEVLHAPAFSGLGDSRFKLAFDTLTVGLKGAFDGMPTATPSASSRRQRPGSPTMS